MKDNQENEKNIKEEATSNDTVNETAADAKTSSPDAGAEDSKSPEDSATTELAATNTESSTAEKEAPAASAPLSEEAEEPTPAEQAVTQKKSSIWIAILALIIALVALAGGAYLYLQLTKMKSENVSLQEKADGLAQSLQQVKGTTSSQTSQNKTINSSLKKLDTSVNNQKADLDEMQQRLTKGIKQISQLGTNSRKDWLLAESEYLLRLANQRILLEKSPIGALALMKSADEILKETDDVSLYNVRKAIAMDVAALEAVPKLDVDGVFLKLVALNQQVDNLSLLPVSESPELPEMLKDVDEEALTETWQQGLKEGWNTAMDKLGSLIIIQHRDESIEPLLTHEQGYFIQQNLHLMIEQAQLALLQGHQQSYDASLSKATDWIGRYFRADDSTTQALIKGLDELKPVQVAPKLPDISGSLRALKQYFADIQSRKQ